MFANSPSATSYALLQTVKGSVYVLITALLAWTLVRTTDVTDCAVPLARRRA